jgi:hypothetical protein
MCRVVSIVVVLALLAGTGCGGAAHRADPAAAQPRRASGPAPQARPALARPRDDRALAAAALLAPGDLRGWSPHPAAAPDLRCASRPFRTARAKATSDRFVREETVVQESVAVFRTTAASRRAFARLNSPASMGCLKRNVRRRMSEHVEGVVSRPQVVRVDASGPTIHAIRFASTAESQIGTVHGVIDAVHVRVGRGIGALLVVSGPALVTDEGYDAIVAAFRRRLDGALGGDG